MCVDLLETIPTAVCTLQVYNCRFRTCASSYMCKHSYITASKVNAIPIYSSQFLWNLKMCFSSSTLIPWRWQDNPGGRLFSEAFRSIHEMYHAILFYFDAFGAQLLIWRYSISSTNNGPHITGTHISPHIRWWMHETREWALCFLFLLMTCWGS